MLENEKLWYKVARTVVKVGGIPFPISDSLIEIVKVLITEEQTEIIFCFKKPSMTLDQLIQKSKLDKQRVIEMLDELIENGVVVVIPSRSTGVMVYYLLGPVPGIFEHVFMTGKTSEREKKLAKLFAAYFNDIGTGYQKNYDNTMELFKEIPSIYRIVPVEKEVDVPQELVLPYEVASKIVEKFDIIAVSYCYCRHQRDLLNEPCEISAPRKNCLFFGQTARFNIDYNFAWEISKEEAIKLLKEAEDFGLIHRAFHARQDPKKDEFAICNCCKCCCEVSHSFYKEGIPMKALTSYEASVIEELCISCETCIEKCPMEAIELSDSIVEINEGRCIGCGICAHHCPQEAIKLRRTGPRDVLLPSPIIKEKV